MVLEEGHLLVQRGLGIVVRGLFPVSPTAVWGTARVFGPLHARRFCWRRRRRCCGVRRRTSIAVCHCRTLLECRANINVKINNKKTRPMYAHLGGPCCHA